MQLPNYATGFGFENGEKKNKLFKLWTRLGKEETEENI